MHEEEGSKYERSKAATHGKPVRSVDTEGDHAHLFLLLLHQHLLHLLCWGCLGRGGRAGTGGGTTWGEGRPHTSGSLLPINERKTIQTSLQNFILSCESDKNFLPRKVWTTKVPSLSCMVVVDFTLKFLLEILFVLACECTRYT